ncbi:hypothetical protein J3R30DRAFT_3296605 [Lentinula aciculospora]|uniref:Thioesterase/thiol ester dehydrase-isomerase n=1 Tax=Lentinula aciculospora TaxID=153920 RepID=A0A9W9A3W7_9AGAR|nr:hypothetical protein J3R30DRAFT_3296605 [Lentinula aciculospora]
MQLLSQVVKWMLSLLLLLNIRAFPTVWHFRIFRPLIYIWVSQFLLKIRAIFLSKSAKAKAFEHWIDSLTPVGASPFQSTVFRSWASIDESDYNFHLSNSSYAKALDAARFKLACQLLPKFIVAGGVIPLAGTHFQFVREIPILAKYEVRVTLQAWDEKWIYIVCRFVSKHKSKRSTSVTAKKNDTETSPSFFHAPVSSGGVSMSSTPLNSPTPVPPTDMDKLASKLLATEEPDGATLHTITVSQMCFKMGRITVPPAVIFAINGLCVPSTPTLDSTFDTLAPETYSPANPPPHWDKVKSIASRLHGGSIGKLQSFLRGGWKDVPEGERWWEQAMGGAVELQRQQNLQVLDLLRKGMAGAREIR